MSRIGKQPIAIPSGVEVSVEGNVLKFKKGAHLKELDTKGHVDVKVEDAHIVFSPKSDERQDRAVILLRVDDNRRKLGIKFALKLEI